MNTIDEMITLLQAYKEGKTIQVRYKEGYKSVDGTIYHKWEDCKQPRWNFDDADYRIKPEPYYRPFKNAGEVMKAIKEHGNYVFMKAMKELERYTPILDVDYSSIHIEGHRYKFEEVIEAFEFADGTPFGVKEDSFTDSTTTISQKIGTLYDDGSIKGIVASVDENNNPHLIMALDGPEDLMTWNEARKWGKSLKDGWHIPTKEELEEVWHDDGTITKILNKGLKQINGKILEGGFWSSSQYSADSAYIVYTNNCRVGYSLKYNHSYVRPFAVL